MESNKIKDFQISSHTFSPGWLPEHGRLNNNNGAWCSANNDKTSEYFEIDLLRVRHVSAIGTQGVQTWNYLSYYVKTYVIKYSYDGRAWLTYKDTDDGPDKVCNPQCVLGEVSFTFTMCVYNAGKMQFSFGIFSVIHWKLKCQQCETEQLERYICDEIPQDIPEGL